MKKGFAFLSTTLWKLNEIMDIEGISSVFLQTEVGIPLFSVVAALLASFSLGKHFLCWKTHWTQSLVLGLHSVQYQIQCYELRI
jgi:hypothetical protein